MKIIFILISIMLANVSYGQIQVDTIKGVKLRRQKLFQETDTIPKIIYLTKDEVVRKPLVYLNKNIVEEQILRTINPNVISGIEIKKDSMDNGEIFITTKEKYLPSFISLKELKTKYVKNLNGPTLFLLNEETINSDYDSYLVDEKFILKILVEKIENEKEGLDLNLIRLITRTKENLEKANTLYLRGEYSNN